jgi:ribosome-binding ATPase
MRIGLIGLPGSGKSTCFRMLTGKREGHAKASDVGVVEVPDPRTERLAEIYQPQRVVQPEITFLDVMALRQGDSRHAADLDLVKIAGDAAALAVVLQGCGELGHRGEPLDPAEDLEAMLTEMALTDLCTLDSRLQRIQARGGRLEARAEWEVELMERCHAGLSEGVAVGDQQLAEDECKHLRGFSLLTMKPSLVILNVAEDDLAGERAGAARELCEARGLPWVVLCAELEEEIAQLPADEQAGFAADFGLQSPGRDRFIQAAYDMLQVLTFFTGNDREVHAWTVSAGTTAWEAAGRVHSDLQQGFIRAEVIPFADLDRTGSVKACREQGRMRLEGRDYVVADGDVLLVRFSH